MMLKWILAAVLSGGLTPTVSESVRAQEYERPVIRVELCGRLEVVGTPVSASDDNIGACLPPPFQYFLEVGGRRYFLQMTSEMGKGAELHGMWVVVSGELNLDSVRVQALRQSGEDARAEYTKVFAPGRLQLVRALVRDVWQLRVGEQVF